MIFIKLLQINICPDLSTGSLMMKINDYLNKSGHNGFTSSAPKKGFNNLKNHYFIGSWLSRRIHIYLARKVKFEMSLSIFSTWKFIRYIKKLKPDIIHLHNIHGYFLNFRILFSFLRKVNIPIIWTLHDCWAYTGVCHHYTEMKCEKWKDQCTNCPLFAEDSFLVKINHVKSEFIMKKKYYKDMKNLYVTTVSDWLYNEVEYSILRDKPRFKIYNGVNIDEYTTTNKSINRLNNKFKVLCAASSWSINKGIQDIKLLSDLLKDNNNIEISVIGLTESQKEDFKDKSNVHCYGPMKKNELIDWYLNSDLFFNPSTEESFGMVTLEAMASGLKVIVYNSTASPEIVFGTESYICEKHDLKCVVNTINKLSLEGIEMVSTNIALKKIDNLYNLDKKILEYIELYNYIYSLNRK